MNIDSDWTAPKTSNKLGVKIAIAALIFIALIIGLIFALTINPARTANIRDIVIIVLAGVTILGTIANTVLIAIMLYRLQELISTVRTEVKPILLRVSQTVDVVRNTTSLVNENIARPAVRAASFLAVQRRKAKSVESKATPRKSSKPF